MCVCVSMTACISQYQKSRNILDFNEARDDGVAVASAGPYANDVHISPDRLDNVNIISLLCLVVYRVAENNKYQPKCALAASAAALW